MKIDEKRLKELDRLNLLKVLELVSAGNLMRGLLWAGKSLKGLRNYLSELAWQNEEEEETEEEQKEEKDKGERKKRVSRKTSAAEEKK